MLCKNCGQPLKEGDLFCGECGTKVEKESVSEASDTTVHTYSSNNTVEQPVHQETRKNTHQTQETHSSQATSSITIDKEALNAQSKAVANEGKFFFRDALKSHDSVLHGNKSYSFTLNILLLLGGLILLALSLAKVIPPQVNMFTSKSSLVFETTFGVFVYLALVICATFGLAALIIKKAPSFLKVFSDYMLINTIVFIFLVLSTVLILVNTYELAAVLIILSVVLLTYSPIYLLTKYSAIRGSKNSELLYYDYLCNYINYHFAYIIRCIS